MSEYIKREACCADCIHYCVCKDTVADENWDENIPKELKEMFSPSGCENYKSAADVVEVRHGVWNIGVDVADYEYGICSACGYVEWDAFPVGRTPNYCPNCGAKMDGKGEG